MPRECAVTRAYLKLNTEDREDFKRVIVGTMPGGVVANALMQTTGVIVDHMAVDHFRRKVRTGKVKLDELD